jgi:CubicO group peptidase (beta-lactamase class C family)
MDSAQQHNAEMQGGSLMTARLNSLARWLLLSTVVWLNAGCDRPAIPADDVPLRAFDGHFPGAEWRTSPPEAQGIDSEMLVTLMDAVEANRMPIHSLHIVRYGHLVLDAYFHPFLQGERHDVASVTKSVTTTLVGLALDRGALAGLDVPVYPLLSPVSPANARKQQIRLRHLLTTSSGLDCGHAPYEPETLAMAASVDWVRFALDLPMRETPGTRFVYCSPGFHLLSALITRGTGLAAEDFAREALFAPIGIGDVRWPRDPQGISHGAGNLQLQPTDLLRLGYLFLRQGEWGGRQVIPREWIAQATRRQVDATGSQGYGFGWWVSTDILGMYQAAGRGGQRLILWPDKDIVVVVTAGGFDPAQVAPFLLRSLKSNAALPKNPEGHERLLARVRAAAQPRPTGGTAPPLPARAAAIDGVDYDLDPNLLGVRGMQLRFRSQALAQARFRLRETELVVPVGLDGAYRVGIDPASTNRVAGRGRWTGPDQLVLEIDTIAGINHFTVMLDFEGDRLQGHVSERAGLIGEMVLKGQGQR